MAEPESEQYMKRTYVISVLLLLCLLYMEGYSPGYQHPQFSGIYPHLAYYNNEAECGTGAVVAWAGRLWLITYGPHLPFGSSDKLYEISPDLTISTRSESVGGTPANRMIHEESNRLFIGPYAIDAEGNVRVIPYEAMPGRHTGNARHLFDPVGKIYYATMEEGFYEVDVNTLEVKVIHQDANVNRRQGEMDQVSDLLPGAHGKGLYSGQGVLVYSNNGEATEEALRKFDIESGALAEWDGKAWKLVRRNQFVEVTGPGGIYGNKNPDTDPIWATGWDHKSVILGVRDAGKWSFYRLPKASHSYDGAHGWNTEWPRIRDVGTPGDPDYLMTMHGMFWRFPGSFQSGSASGLRPRSAYLKVIGDYTRWNGRLVFGCDDSARNEFLNKRKAKGGIEGPGQSNSNLWFTPVDLPDKLGPVTSSGAVWLNEMVQANNASEPYLFAGWPYRTAWLKNEGKATVAFTFQIDRKGNGEWEQLQSLSVPPGGSRLVEFAEKDQGEWIRVATDKETRATVHFSYTAKDGRENKPDKMFEGLSLATNAQATGGLLYGLGDDRKALGVAAMRLDGDNRTDTGYYELDGEMKLERREDPATHRFITENFVIPRDVLTLEESSVLVIDDAGRRWRLPLGPAAFTRLTESASLRLCREVATERDLFNCHGTFYELPAENADGFAKIRPVASHPFRIHDYASYRGLLILTGIDSERAGNNPHVITSSDGKAAVWAGVIDDLWKLGRPVGEGGPWKYSKVASNEVSDPYLIGFYAGRELSLSHDTDEAVAFSVEIDPSGHGPWIVYKVLKVPAGEELKYTFPENFQARWVRFRTDKDCRATTWLRYF
jgi:hypothetical protein